MPHALRSIVAFVFGSSLLFAQAWAEPIVTKLAQGTRVEIDVRASGISVPLPEGLEKELSGLSETALSQKLIKELVRSGKYRDVVVRRELDRAPERAAVAGSERWSVSLKPQRMIYGVSISGLGFVDEEQYRKRLSSRAGSIFLEDSLNDDVTNLTAALQERGYPFARVATVQVRAVPSGAVVIEFVVERGLVCRLSEVRTTGDSSLLQRVTLPIELGAICNLPSIRKNLAAEQEKLRQSGYLEAKIQLDSVRYSDDKSSASLSVMYHRGPLTRIEAIDLATGAIRDDFVKSDGGISSFDLAHFGEEDLLREVRSVYLADGYAQVKIDGPRAVQLKSGDRVQRFYVQKGPRIIVGLVEFSGDRLPVPRADALKAMNLSPGLLSQSVPYDERRLSEYRDNLQALLLASGFGDVQVDLPRVSLSRSGGTARLDFNIRIGKIYSLAEMSVLGLPEGFEVIQADLDDIVEPGEPLSVTGMNDLREALRKQLIEGGHYYAQVRENPVLLNETADEKRIQLILEVDAGPITRVRSVYLEGETYGKSERIKAVSMLKRGDVFSPSALERARRRVMKYELFSAVSVEAYDLSAIERRDTEIDVVIRTTGRSGYTLALNPAYGSRNGYRFGVEFVRNELNESGLRFNANAAVSQDKEQLPIGEAPQQLGRQVTVGLTEPLFRVGQWVSPFDARVLAGTEVSNISFESRIFETTEVSLRWRPVFFDQDFDFEWGLAREWSRILSRSIQPLDVINNPSLQIHEVVLKGAFDSRDSIEWARRGMYHEVVTQHARFGLDSDVAYDRYTVSSNFFFPFLSRWSHAVSVGFISISDVFNKSKTTVTAPSSRRAALTGRASVRGFPENGRSLGPLIWLDLEPRSAEGTSTATTCRNAVRSIGATNVAYTKYELRYRTSYLNNMLGLAWFVDSGAAFFSDGELATIKRGLDQEIGKQGASDDPCVLQQARVVQPPNIGKRGSRTPASYLRAAYVSSGFGLRFIIPNFAAISVDWGLPVQDPAESSQSSCPTISEAEENGQAPSCIRRDRQDRIFGTIPFPGSFYVGIGATL